MNKGWLVSVVRKMTCDGDPSAQTLVECASEFFRELRSPMDDGRRFDVHRKQITFDSWMTTGFGALR